MMTVSEMRDLVSAITYKPGWSIRFVREGARPYVQAFVGVESDSSLDSAARDGTREPWATGKRYLSWHMTRQEVVSAVFGLLKDAEEHETREWFRYKGASIFNPHLDPDVLARVAKDKRAFIMRDNPMSMVESDEAS